MYQIISGGLDALPLCHLSDSSSNRSDRESGLLQRESFDELHRFARQPLTRAPVRTQFATQREKPTLLILLQPALNGT